MNKTQFALSSAAILLAVSGGALAHGDSHTAGNDGGAYISNGSGDVINTGLDTCLRSGNFSEDGQINVCEGIEDTVAEPAPEPEAETVAAPEPVVAPKEPTITTATLGGEALFDSNSADLNAAGEAAVGELVSELGGFQEIESISIVGHTDSTGSADYNQSLSERRAATVAGILEASYPGISISSAGAGESSPIDSNDTSEGRQANRRVEIEVLAKSISQ